MSEAVTNIAAAAARDKERLRARAKTRIERVELDTLKDLWSHGLAEPTERFFEAIASRDAFPRGRADGEPGLLPLERITAFPNPNQGGLYAIVRGFDAFALARERLPRHEAWRAGIAAVRASNAEFSLLNRPPIDGRLFAPSGLRCVVHPDGRGGWAWGAWGADGVPRGEAGLTKAECLEGAEECAGCGGEVAITNFVPICADDWEEVYAG